MTKITAKNVAQGYVNVWITQWGIPLHVITNRGRQFESELFAKIAKLLGFYRLRTTAYHSQTNYLVGWSHTIIKTTILARKSLGCQPYLWSYTIFVVWLTLQTKSL